jgi:hypothetical protein
MTALAEQSESLQQLAPSDVLLGQPLWSRGEL